MTDAAVDEIIDIAFHLPGGRLPVDHAYALFKAISAALPWFEDDPGARLHQIHTAATGSGWMRPDESPGDELHLSRRTRLKLRLPASRAEAAMSLSGYVMDVGGYALKPGAGKLIALTPASTLLARHIVCEDSEDESRFVTRLQQLLHESGVKGASLICGRAHRIVTADTTLHTRSLVVTKLDPDGAMALLRHGIGSEGKLGCGIFVPYKRIEQ